MKPAFLIAATSSGCGKTTLSLGLMRAMVRRGLSVQPFKCGPDYIDTQFQAIASGRESINLDLFMASKAHVRYLFSHYSEESDVSIVEGVMGLFDGFDKMRGSSAELSRVLDIPVVLLINAASSAYSVAATIYGFTHFMPEVKVSGVIFNRVASENHFSFLREACLDTGTECFGYIGRNQSLQTPSRHLGLTLTARDEMERFVNLAADEVERNVDISRLLTSVSTPKRVKEKAQTPVSGNLTAAVARDEAFSFIYPANLRSVGKVIYFSPLHDKHLPEADIVYFPGGYPELYASELAANSTMIKETRAFADNGGYILAECGGLIYLCDEIDGHRMCGIFPLKATMKASKLTLGYRSVMFPDITLKGHEFHYSHIVDPMAAETIAFQEDAKGRRVSTHVYRYKNTIAGYTHLYWAEADILRLWK